MKKNTDLIDEFQLFVLLVDDFGGPTKWYRSNMYKKKTKFILESAVNQQFIESIKFLKP